MAGTLCIKTTKSQELKQVWGTWLTEIGQNIGGWDWWFTGTFRDRPQEDIKRGWTKPGWAYTAKAWLDFMGELRARRGIGEPIWVAGREYQKERGVPHFHALISGVSNLRRTDAWAWWFKHYGINRIEPYNRHKGAGYYLCKYVTKELGDIQFSQGMEHLTTIAKGG